MVAPLLSVSGPLLVSDLKIKISQNKLNFSNKNVCLFVTVFPSESQSPCPRVARLKMTEAGVFCTESSSMGLMTCQVINVVLAYYHVTSKSSSLPNLQSIASCPPSSFNHYQSRYIFYVFFLYTKTCFDTSLLYNLHTNEHV